MPEEGRCLGYLLILQGKVFDATIGLIEDVTPSEAKEHNKVFDKMIMEGLEGCKVGQGG